MSSIFDRLRLLKECPLCGVSYSGEAASSVEKRQDAELVHITCQECLNAVLTLVVVSGVGMSTVGIVTDLTAEDARRLKRKEVINSDKVLSFHELLKIESNFERTVYDLVNS